MGTLQRYAGRELIWEPSRDAKRTYALRAGDETLATLAQPSMWSQQRAGASDEGRFTFARVGFFKQRIVVTDTATQAEVASMPPIGFRGTSSLTMPDGRTYHWRKEGVFSSSWIWLDAMEQPIMRLRQTGAFHVRCAVTLTEAGGAERHLALLAQLGWFLMLLATTDAVMTTTAATTAAGV